MKIAKSELIKNIAGRVKCSQAIAAEALDAVFDELADQMAANNSVSIPGFGVFSAVTRAPRKMSAAFCGVATDVLIGERQAPHFKASDKLKKLVASRAN